MKFPDWLGAVEVKLGFELGDEATVEALRHYREGWSVDEYATEIDEQLLGETEQCLLSHLA
jgi:hypothetical protein